MREEFQSLLGRRDMDNRPTFWFYEINTVVQQLLRQLPQQDVVYIGDSKACTLCPRPADQIMAYLADGKLFNSKMSRWLSWPCRSVVKTAVVWEGFPRETDLVWEWFEISKILLNRMTHQNWGHWDTDVSSGIYVKEKNSKSGTWHGSHGLACPKFVPLVNQIELADPCD